MSISVECASCGRKLRVPDAARGKTARCPGCGTRFTVEADDETPEVEEALPAPRKRRPEAAADPASAKRRSARAEDDEEERPRRSRDADEDEEEEDRPRRPRRRKPKKSALGLVLGLVFGGLILVGGLVVMGLAVARMAGGKKIADSEWKAFTPPNGRCSVLLPGTPTSQPLDSGALTGGNYILQRTDANVGFAVGFIDFAGVQLPPDALNTLSRKVWEASARKMDGTVLAEQNITLAGHAGKEVRLNSRKTKGFLIQRTYLVRGAIPRVYVIEIGGINVEPGKGMATKFFDSFTIEAPPPAAPNPQAAPANANPQPNPQPIRRPRRPRGPPGP